MSDKVLLSTLHSLLAVDFRNYPRQFRQPVNLYYTLGYFFRHICIGLFYGSEHICLQCPANIRIESVADKKYISGKQPIFFAASVKILPSGLRNLN